VIFWKDFIFDDVLGPVLAPSIFESNDSETDLSSCRKERFGSPSVQEDAMGSVLIQETGQEQRPARMVGHSSLDSTLNTQTHMEVTGDRAENLRLVRGEA
jgi:hypothetical protein